MSDVLIAVASLDLKVPNWRRFTREHYLVWENHLLVVVLVSESSLLSHTELKTTYRSKQYHIQFILRNWYEISRSNDNNAYFVSSRIFWRRWLPNRPLQSFKQFFSAKDYTISNLKWTDSKLLLFEISICRNCPSVGCLKCVQFHNRFRLHLIQAKIIKKSATIAFSPILFPHPCFFYFSFAFSLLVWFLSLSGAKNPCLLALHFLTQECKWLQSVLSKVRG